MGFCVSHDIAVGVVGNMRVHRYLVVKNNTQDRPMTLSTFRNVTASIALIGTFASPALAQDKSQIETLFDSMGLPDMLEIMREEGVSYGAEIGEGVFQGKPSPAWNAIVEGIYDTSMMRDRVLTDLAAELEGDDIAAIQTFFDSELGVRIVDLEVAARRALLDDTIKQASNEVAALAIADKTPRYLLVSEFVDANDLIETNVAGALNSNYAFFMGLMEGGALGEGMSEDEVLANLWTQEPEIRQSTTEWVYAYSLLAYQPLSDDDLQAYIDFSNTQAGRDINTAMFASFDGVFEDISHALGLASTQVALSEEL